MPVDTKASSREILAIEPMYEESEDSWRKFFQKLKKGGRVKQVCLCVLNAHAGIQAAVK
jgi:transposase-like protein